ncbi:MAG: right-handed parallel beta-helix repeat-containing protein [Candidatus Electryonea clarkiae]|nr:right-handed parallel beta-helix repeat-containing protein [Candidatus Electryonea clarkiae]MDP8285574.1 right-handed parallel beta-helix repeat-containing protein [Candidatus Electryonea clarkiae]
MKSNALKPAKLFTRFLFAAICIICCFTESQAYDYDDIHLGFWTVWKQSQWTYAVETEDSLETLSDEYLRLKGTKATFMMSNVANEYTHIQDFNSHKLGIIVANTVLSSPYRDTLAWGDYDNALPRLGDWIATDSFRTYQSLQDSVYDRTTATIKNLHSNYQPGMPGFAAYEMSTEFARDGHDSTDDANWVEYLDFTLDKIRSRDLLTPVVLSGGYWDMAKHNHDTYDDDPDSMGLYPVRRPFIYDEEGAGWNIFVNFYYNLMGDSVWIDIGHDMWKGYKGFNYQQLLWDRFRTMRIGSDWVYDYADNFDDEDFQNKGGPRPFWVECIPAHRSYRPHGPDTSNVSFQPYHRRPTKREMKMNAYLGLATGAKGIQFFSYTGNFVSQDSTPFGFKDGAGHVKFQGEYTDFYSSSGEDGSQLGVRHGMIDYICEDPGEDECDDFRRPLDSSYPDTIDVNWDSEPYGEIAELYDSLRTRLPKITELEWVWAINGVSTGAGDGSILDQLNFYSPREIFSDTLLNGYFRIANIEGDEEYFYEPNTYSNAFAGLFLDPSEPGAEYYLVVNSRCNKMNGDRVEPADADTFDLGFYFDSTDCEYGKYYNVYDVFENYELLKHWEYPIQPEQGGFYHVDSIALGPGEAKLIKFEAGADTFTWQQDSTEFYMVDTVRTDITGGSVEVWGYDYMNSRIVMDWGINVEDPTSMLIIEKGTLIDVNGYHKLQIFKEAKLRMNGTPEEPIIFRLNPSEDASLRSAAIPDSLDKYWDGIYYWASAADPDTLFDHVFIEEAYQGFFMGRDADIQNFTFDNCYYSLIAARDWQAYVGGNVTFDTCTVVNSVYGPIYNQCTEIVITNCRIENIDKCGIDIFGFNRPVTSMDMSNNRVQNCGWNGLKILEYNNLNSTISNNWYMYNGKDETNTYSGINLSSATGISFKECSIDRNNNSGIDLVNSSIYLDNTQISENGITAGITQTPQQFELFADVTSSITPIIHNQPNELFDDVNDSTYLVGYDGYPAQPLSLGDVFWGNETTPDNRFYTPNNGLIVHTPVADSLRDDDDFYIKKMFDVYEITPEGLLTRAYELADSGNVRDAIRTVSGLIDSYPNHHVAPDAQRLWAVLYMLQGNSAEDVVIALRRVPYTMTARHSILARKKLVVTYLCADNQFDDATDELLDIAEDCNNSFDSLRALIQREEIYIAATRLERLNNEGRRFLSGANEELSRQTAIIYHENEIHKHMSQLNEIYGDRTEIQEIPREFNLKHSYPNPFNQTVFIPFALPKQTEVKIIIYNLLGQEVAELVNRKVTAGNHKIIWQGVNNKGIPVASGIYFVNMKASNHNQTRKMVLLK